MTTGATLHLSSCHLFNFKSECKEWMCVSLSRHYKYHLSSLLSCLLILPKKRTLQCFANFSSWILCVWAQAFKTKNTTNLTDVGYSAIFRRVLWRIGRGRVQIACVRRHSRVARHCRIFEFDFSRVRTEFILALSYYEYQILCIFDFGGQKFYSGTGRHFQVLYWPSCTCSKYTDKE